MASVYLCSGLSSKGAVGKSYFSFRGQSWQEEGSRGKAWVWAVQQERRGSRVPCVCSMERGGHRKPTWGELQPRSWAVHGVNMKFQVNVDWGVKLETGQFLFLVNSLRNSWRVARCAKPILSVLDNAMFSNGEYYTVFLHLAMSHLGCRWVLH